MSPTTTDKKRWNFRLLWLPGLLLLSLGIGLPYLLHKREVIQPILVITTPPALKVSESGRHLVQSDGKPFFWMADTAWQLIHDLNPEEVEHYLQDRAAKGFNVIQTVALAERGGVESSNAYGHAPFRGRNVARPDVRQEENYWTHVDHVIQRAAHHGIYVALTPTWGSHVTRNSSNGKVNGVFTPEKAEAYGRFLGERYGQASNIVWMLGGDRAASTGESKTIWREMAYGIAKGAAGGKADQAAVLMTYHPNGHSSSSDFFDLDPWVDFHGIQSGHSAATATWKLVQRDYHRVPAKPVIDLETTYDEIIFGSGTAPVTADVVRRAAYSAVFAGAAGHTYGHNSVWQFCNKDRGRAYGAKTHWQEALSAPSAMEIGHLRRLMESHDFLTQVPDASLIVAAQPDTAARTLALRGEAAALVYFPMGRTQDIRLGHSPGKRVAASWFDPRTGQSQPIGELENTGQRPFDPPGAEAPGNDWVLVLSGLK